MKKRSEKTLPFRECDAVKDFIENLNRRYEKYATKQWEHDKEADKVWDENYEDSRIGDELQTSEIPEKDVIYYLFTEKTNSSTHMAVPRQMFFAMASMVKEKFCDTDPKELYEDEVALWARLQRIIDTH